MTIYERYCMIRDSKGLKDSHVANGTQIGKSTFSDWKSGRSTPKDEKLQKIADYLGVSVEYLRTGKEGQTVLSPKNEKDISKTLTDVLSQISSQDGLSFFGYSLDEDEETKAYLEASLLTAITNAKIKAKEKYTPNKYKNK